MNNNSVTPIQVKDIFSNIKAGKKVFVRNQELNILDIKLANDSYDYAKVKIKLTPNKTQYLELYWEGPYLGIELSEDIDEFSNFDFENFDAPKALKRHGIKYELGDQGSSIVTDSDPTGDYHQGDKVSYWEYFSKDKRTRISLGYNQRSRKWLNMFAEKLNPSEITY